MNGDRIAMSARERDRLKVMAPVLDGKRTQAEAARLMNLCVRQVRRLQRRLEQDGDAGIIHRLRGLPSNRRRDADVRRQAVEIYRRERPDFNLTMASEKLAARKVKVPARTLRDWLSAEGLWQPKYRRDRHRSRRERRACLGELVQADGSHHDWLEGRGPWMVLVAMIDDATSKVTARFYPGETTEAYMDLLRRYLARHGRMAAMYVDRDGIFRAEDHDPHDPQPTLTQFSRALDDLDIQLILVYSAPYGANRESGNRGSVAIFPIFPHISTYFQEDGECAVRIRDSSRLCSSARAIGRPGSPLIAQSECPLQSLLLMDNRLGYSKWTDAALADGVLVSGPLACATGWPDRPPESTLAAAVFYA